MSVVLTNLTREWGRARAEVEAARIKLDQARDREAHLAISWIADGVSLETYDKAREIFAAALLRFDEFCAIEGYLYDLVTRFQQEDPADLDARIDDLHHKLTQS